MVVSTMPLVIGNKQPDTDLNAVAAVAFVGQVPVRVIGEVSTGDYIIASGNNDGTAIAVHPDHMTVANVNAIIGRAWSESTDSAEKLINVAITPLDIPTNIIESLNCAKIS